MKKKIISIILAAIMVTGVAACSKEADTNKGSESQAAGETQAVNENGGDGEQTTIRFVSLSLIHI